MMQVKLFYILLQLHISKLPTDFIFISIAFFSAIFKILPFIRLRFLRFTVCMYKPITSWCNINVPGSNNKPNFISDIYQLAG